MLAEFSRSTLFCLPYVYTLGRQCTGNVQLQYAFTGHQTSQTGQFINGIVFEGLI